MDEVATKIIDILKKHMKEPRDDIDTSTELTALEIESLDLAMIVFDIEDTFGVPILGVVTHVATEREQEKEEIRTKDLPRRKPDQEFQGERPAFRGVGIMV